jgi:hypothetical protein
MITQIGSLPYGSVREAVDYSMRHDIPFLPELPRLGEAMMDYIKNPGSLSCLREFQGAVKGGPLVKIQGVGPATIVSAGRGKYTEEDALRMSKEHILRIIDGFNVEKLIFFLDEPSLEVAGFDCEAMGMTKDEYKENTGLIAVDYKSLWRELYDEVISDLGITFGVHTCGNFDWNELLRLDFLDMISFDASRYGDLMVKSGSYRNGKKMAWGVEGSGDAIDFKKGDIITPPCGLGNMSSAERCEPILQGLKEAGAGHSGA